MAQVVLLARRFAASTMLAAALTGLSCGGRRVGRSERMCVVMYVTVSNF